MIGAADTAARSNRPPGAPTPVWGDPGDDQTESADGRTARSIRTRDSVVEALLDLLCEGDPRPTARAIAERAGVSLRSVYVHFDDLEDLFLAAAGRQFQRIAPLLEPITTDAPLDERIANFAARQATLLEATTPVRLAASLQAPFSPVIAEIKRRLYAAALTELEVVFGTEVDRHSEPERHRLLSSLEVATCGHAWTTLRTDAHLTVTEAKASMHAHLSLLLSERTCQ